MKASYGFKSDLPAGGRDMNPSQQCKAASMWYNCPVSRWRPGELKVLISPDC